MSTLLLSTPSVLILPLCTSAIAQHQGTNSAKTSVAVHTMREDVHPLSILACTGMSHLGGFLALQPLLSSYYDHI